MNNKFDIEEKIDLLYNFNYNPEFPNCYELNKINFKNIKLSDVKIPVNNIEVTEELTTHIFNGKFKLIKYNKDNNYILLKRFSDHFPVTLMISPYVKEKTSGILSNSNNNDSMFSYLLSNLVMNKLTNHILLPIVNFDVKYKQFSDIINSVYPKNNFVDDIDSNKTSDLFSIRVKENYFRSINLHDYLKENKCSLKPLLFQVIHTLAVIQKEHNGFRHNKLNLDNIIIYIKKNNDDQTRYLFAGKEYYLTGNNFDIKISNFSYSTIPQIETINKKIPFLNKKNNYFDLHYFLNTLLYKYKIDKCDKETEDFLLEILPKKFRGKGKNNFYLESNVELFDPSKLLKHKYFSLYFKKNDKMKMFLNNSYQSFEIKHLNKIDDISGSRMIKKNLEKSSKKLSKSYKGMEKNYKDKKKSSKFSHRKLKQEGGGNKVIKPPYTKEKNSPHISNDERNVEKKRSEEVHNNTFDKRNLDHRKSFYDQSREAPREPRGIPRPRGPPEARGPPRPRGPSRPYSPRGPSRPYSPRGPSRPYSPRGPSRPYSPSGPSRGPSSGFQPYHQGLNNYSQPPIYIPVGDGYYPARHNMLPYPYSNHINKNIPIQKTYNINLSNANGNGHSVLNRVFEDMIPGNQHPLGFTTFFEREQFFNFIRTLIINKNDGEVMNITGGKNSLLSYIKLSELNPYAIGMNPVKELSRGFLMYNSAYPIRYNNSTNSLETPKMSNGINIRIYRLSLGAYRANAISKNINWYNFDVWREIRYYEYVRNEILKKKISPNFVNLLLYKIDTESKINWSKLTQLIYKSDPQTVLKNLNKNDETINDKHQLKSTVLGYLISRGKLPLRTNIDNYLKKYINSKMKKTGTSFYYKTIGDQTEVIKVITKNSSKSKIYMYKKDSKEFVRVESDGIISDNWTKCTDVEQCLKVGNLTEDSLRSLVALTESPTHNLITWCSPQYAGQGSVKKMIATGHRTVVEWKSVLFQFVYTCAVLQKKRIRFNSMSFENNFFVKDTFADYNNLGFWIYKVNDLSFYVPNYGYILLFDSRYIDVKYSNDNTINDVLDIDKKTFKIVSDNLFTENGDMNGKLTNIENDIFDDFKKMIKLDNFKNILSKYGGHIPHDDIINLLSNMSSDSEKDISNYILKYFKEYTHNKIGLNLTESEHKLINHFVRPVIKKGKMCVMQLRFNEYIWVQVIEDMGDMGTTSKILYKKDANSKVEELTIFNHRLLAYHRNEKISLNAPLNDSNLLEIYNLNN